MMRMIMMIKATEEATNGPPENAVIRHTVTKKREKLITPEEKERERKMKDAVDG